jgi:anti-sigma regulatory factor (Ser/Thr protein kinase)
METLTLELRVENRFAEIQRVNEQFNAFAVRNGLPDVTRRKFNTVFDELLNNIISYAFQDDGLHIIIIFIQYVKPKITVEISDDGVPFNLFEVSPPDTEAALGERPIGGLGIHLVRSMMDEHHYERKNDRNKTTLIKWVDE